MTRIKIKTNLHIFFLLALGGLLLVTGCAMGPATPVTPVVYYKADFNSEKQPQMSLSEAFQNIKRLAVLVGVPNLNLTGKGFSWMGGGNTKCSGKFDDVHSLSVTPFSNPSYPYAITWTISGKAVWYWAWASQTDAQCFVDSVMAMKYYALRGSLADEATAFIEFQEKAKVWQSLSQKPPLSEEVRRFRVLADDAVGNKNFVDAANYYEQGLAIDPLWPAGQFNAALIYGELEIYPMAVMHMKRYLALNPDTKDVRDSQDKLYIWEEKAKKSNALFEDYSNIQPAQS